MAFIYQFYASAHVDIVARAQATGITLKYNGIITSVRLHILSPKQLEIPFPN